MRYKTKTSNPLQKVRKSYRIIERVQIFFYYLKIYLDLLYKNHCSSICYGKN